MIKLLQILSRQAAQSPGTLTLVGERKVDRVTVRGMDYDSRGFEENEIPADGSVIPSGKEGKITWIDVVGIHDIELIKRLCDRYSIHPLTQEDILNTFHRPKVEEIDDYIFMVLKVFRYENNEFQMNNISLILGSDYVISFQEKSSDIFETVRERIRKGGQKIRQGGADYLAYCLVDAVVDYGYVTLERMARNAEDLEEQVMSNPGPDTQTRLHYARREISNFRKYIWPVREIISSILRGESPLVRRPTLIFFRDVYDHTISIIETAESLREQIGGLRDLYLSGISNRMNQIMKTLTIFASIFIPLTFIAGVYGMNFDFMPELRWSPGYFVVLGIMLLAAISLLIYFKRKKWL